jgi:hypothetical protein
VINGIVGCPSPADGGTDGAGRDAPVETSDTGGTGGVAGGGTGTGGTGAGGTGNGGSGMGSGGAGSGGAAGTGGQGTGGRAPGTGGQSGGTGGMAGTGGAGVGGGSGGSGLGGAGTGGSGTGGGPCLTFIDGEGAYVSAATGLAVTTEDFSRDSTGTAITTFTEMNGDGFDAHAYVTFESFLASDQEPDAAAGTSYPQVVADSGRSISSIVGPGATYNGYDGIVANFASPQLVVAVTIDQQSGTDGFKMAVLRSDTSAVTTFPVTFTASTEVGVRSSCGAIIQSIAVSPNPLSTGMHDSQYWELDAVNFAH